jgi:hypothetical protein
MKLKPELVPKPLWGISAYRLLGRGAKWKVIHLDVLNTNGHRCSTCGARGKLSCHERWDYAENRGIATLIGFSANCDACDAATHMGRASQHGSGDSALQQLCAVNGCTEADALKLFENAMKVWRRRNKIEWRTAVSDELLAKYPALIVIHQASTLTYRRD